MAEPRHLLAIDQGTTSTRCILFDAAGKAVATGQAEFPQHYPQDGWVEHDPEDIWRDTLRTGKEAIAAAGIAPADIAAIGITNQRETTIVWDRRTGEPIHKAIVWQDRRTAALCERLKAEGHEPLVRSRTGLLLDPYFSATKLAWLLDHIPGARARAERGELAFGTVDSFLLWRLTGGRVHATDATNASRTLLFDIHRQDWCPDLLAMFGIPRAILPDVRDSSGRFGETSLFGAPMLIAGIAGDQQAALIGQACFERGMAKATYGTGCFMLLNTGDKVVSSENGLLTTTAYRLGGKPSYAVEGAIFVAGATIKWLRDGLGLIARAAESAEMAARLSDNGGVYLVPAFVGLGAPHWNANARGLLCGLTLAAEPAHIVRAALESVAYQTHDLIEAIIGDGATAPAALRIDGGMSANDWLCQFLADILQIPVDRPASVESTALGAAYLAGMETGLWNGLDGIADLPRAIDRFTPRRQPEHRAQLLAGWRAAVGRALG